MVKKILLTLFVLFSFLDANSYEKNCVKCHDKLPLSIDKYFYRYLLVYSSQEEVKSAMIAYFKYPSKKTTVMPDRYINKYGVKNKMQLSDKEFNEAVNTYWEKYNVANKLK